MFNKKVMNLNTMELDKIQMMNLKSWMIIYLVVNLVSEFS